jgi:GTP pyrophosphokinase
LRVDYYLAPQQQISLVNNPQPRVASGWTTMTGAALARAAHAVCANRRVHTSARTTASDERSASHASASARGASPGSRVAPRRFTPSFTAPRSRTGLPRTGATAGRRRVVAAATSEPSDSQSSGAETESSRVESSIVGGTTKDDWSHVTPDWLYRSIEPELNSYLSEFERQEVYQAVVLAFDAHDGQRRKSGEPFITHPVAVAGILAEQKMDHETVIAGLLHDTVEDTDRVTFESIEDRFGRAVRRIVEGETKVSKVSSSVSKKTNPGQSDEASKSESVSPSAKNKNDVQADDLREMFLAMTQEVRVIVVKLADRLHNMRTLGSLKPEKRVKISRETLLVFAPLAKLLGMYSVKNELEDLAFRWSSPEAHAETARWCDELSKRQEPTVRRAAEELRALCESDPFLKNKCARVEVIPRAKELYGVYRKATKEEKKELLTLAERLRSVREVAQLRVVLELDDTTVADGGANGVSTRVCYHVLGLVHERWPPVPGRMNDYIATPKLNGYRALHTVVLPIGETRKDATTRNDDDERKKDVFPIELQIRTGEMHRMAESGIAADPEVKAAWRATARRTARRMHKARVAKLRETSDDASETVVASFPFASMDSDSDSDEDVSDSHDDEEDSVLIRSGHARQVAWLSNIREWQEEFLGVLTAEEFVDTVTGDLLGRRVFVFTPTGGVMNLPHGSTVVDFAFYTDAGLDAVRCSVNGAPCDFDRALKNADVVEIFRAGDDERNVFAKTSSSSSREYDDSNDATRDVSNDSSLNFSSYGLEFSDGVNLDAADRNDGRNDALFNLELLGGAGEASAAAVASAARKQRVATQRRFLQIARTRSARAKIKKFLAEHGALDDEVDGVSTQSGSLNAANRSADEDTLDVTDEIRQAARALVAAKESGADSDAVSSTSSATSPESFRSLSRKVSGARVTLRCVDKDGLLREISSAISAIEGCSIVGYAGESVAKNEFLMTYTIVLETSKLSETEFDGSQSDAEAAVMDVDARLHALFKALRAHDRVLDARLFCKLESGLGDVFGGA